MYIHTRTRTYNASVTGVYVSAMIGDGGGGSGCIAETNVTGTASLHNSMEICRNVYQRHSWI